MGVIKLSDYESQRPPKAESAKILGECRDLALHRLLVSFTSMLDRLSNMLIDQADKAVERDEANLYLQARAVVNKERANIVAEFERILRQRVDYGMSGRTDELAGSFSSFNAESLSLVGDQELEKTIVVDNLARQLESLCRDELVELNQRIGFLLGRYEMESSDNPLSPSAIVKAFEAAVDQVETASDVKLTLLKELNQNVIGDINSIYADLNRHLVHLQVLPLLRPILRRTHDGGRHDSATPDNRPYGSAASQASAQAETAAQEDVFSTLQKLIARAQGRINDRLATLGGEGRAGGGFNQAGGGFGQAGGGGYGQAGGGSGLAEGGLDPMGPVASGVLDALTRLQRGESEFSLAGGLNLNMPSLTVGEENVLRKIAESALSSQMNQVDSITIELVAMIFDYMFEDRALHDGIKALLGRLQIPVLKAAMLDKAFFSKRTHPARMLVDKLADAGLGWSPDQGNDDPLYKKIESIVQRIQNEFTEQVELFAIELADLEEFLNDEDKKAEARIEESATEVYKRDQAEIARIIAETEVDARVTRAGAAAPSYLVAFLRTRWVAPMQRTYLEGGEESAGWKGILATMDDLLWSVEPKRNPDERRRLVKMLPDLLQRLYATLREVNWSPDEQEAFLGSLVGSHAAAVKASLVAQQPAASSAAPAVTESVSDETPVAREPEAQPEPPPEPEQPKRPIDDSFVKLASGLNRGVWVEFTQDGGALVCSRLAWISPLRGNYLFTNRQGRKAFTISREDLAERFRDDRARLVEAEPLLDRALSKVMATLSEPNEELAPA